MPGVILNFVVLISTYKSSQFWKKKCYFTVNTLAVADVLVVVVIHPLIIWITYSVFNEDLKILERSVFIRVFFASKDFLMLLLKIFNIQRFLAIRSSFSYQQHIIVTEVFGLGLCFLCFVILMEDVVWFGLVKRLEYATLPLLSVAFFLHKFRNVSTLKLEKYFNKESKEKCAEWRKDAKWRLLMNHSEDAKWRIQKLFFLIICTSACPCALSVYRTMHAQKMILHNTFIVHIYMWANTVWQWIRPSTVSYFFEAIENYEEFQRALYRNYSVENEYAFDYYVIMTEHI